MKQEKYGSTEGCWRTDQVYMLNKLRFEFWPGGVRNNQVEKSSDVGSFLTEDRKKISDRNIKTI